MNRHPRTATPLIALALMLLFLPTPGSAAPHSASPTATLSLASSSATDSDASAPAVAERAGHRPQARKDRYRVLEDKVLRLRAPGVLKNDHDRQHRLRATQVSSPKLGTARLKGSGRLVYRPSTDAAGRDGFRYRAIDTRGRRATARVVLRVLPVNDAPSFTVGPDQEVAADAGPQTVADWLGPVSPGPANEAGQSVRFEVTVLAGADLLTETPTVSPTGALSFEPATDAASGTARVQVTAVDDGGTARNGQDRSVPRTFTIDVTETPAAPGTVLLSAVSPATEGSEVLLTAVTSGLPAPLTYRFDCDGDGTFDSPSLSTDTFECLYPDDGSFEPLVRVLDGTGLPVTDTVALLISNVAPVVTAPDDTAVLGGVLAPIALGQFTDPGADGPWQVLIEWGDGQTDTFTRPAAGLLGNLSHSFTGGPTELVRTITVTVTEAGGGPSDTATFPVTVLPILGPDNQPPVASDFDLDLPTIPPLLLTLTDAEILGHATDPDGDALTVAGLAGSPVLNILEVLTGWTLVPVLGQSLTYTVDDGHGGTDSGVIDLV